jgi:hypothetical protein
MIARRSTPTSVDALKEHNAALEAHVSTPEGRHREARAQLASAEARASEESAKTTQAIAAFESLAQPLEAMAEARRRPWDGGSWLTALFWTAYRIARGVYDSERDLMGIFLAPSLACEARLEPPS